MADYAILLRDLVTLTCQSVDRIFLQAYVPKLQSMGEVCHRAGRRVDSPPVDSCSAGGHLTDTLAASVGRPDTLPADTHTGRIDRPAADIPSLPPVRSGAGGQAAAPRCRSRLRVP